MHKIIVTPYGGHGTSYIVNAFKKNGIGIVKRPDTVFKWEYNYQIDRPGEAHKREWGIRAGINLDTNATIEQNLLNCIDNARKNNVSVLLSGCCSDNMLFLTRNNIEAICIIRHPLHAYVSFFGHQHPEHANKHGGVNSIPAIHWWRWKWVKIVEDFMLCANAKVVRYEYLTEDLKKLNECELADILSAWDGSSKNWGELQIQAENRILRLTKRTMDDLCTKYEWEI